MGDCKPVGTPVSPGSHLVKATDDEEAVEQQLYQSLVGSLMYLSVCTRPDLAYTVGILARFSSKPNRSHWMVAKRVLRYLKGTANHGIVFTKSESGECLEYSDADWAGTRKTVNPHLVTYSRWLEDQCHVRVESRTVLP